MHRTNILTLLDEYQPLDQDEQTYKEQIIEFITNHDDCFKRSQTKGHITGSAFLLNKQGSHVLLMHHKKLDDWFQLGGHCDGQEDVLAVAIKEAQEESGITAIEPVLTSIFDIDIHRIPANSKEQEHYHYDIRFLLQVTSDEQVQQNSESKELRWIDQSMENIPTDSRSVTRMFEKWLAHTQGQTDAVATYV